MKPVQHFTSKRGKAVVTVYEDNDQRLYVTVTIPRHCWVDYPIRYYDGTIAYDAPYKVPKYARSMVAKAYEWIDQQPAIYTLTPASNQPDKDQWFIECNKADMQPYRCDSILVKNIWEAISQISYHATQNHYQHIEVCWKH